MLTTTAISINKLFLDKTVIDNKNIKYEAYAVG